MRKFSSKKLLFLSLLLVVIFATGCSISSITKKQTENETQKETQIIKEITPQKVSEKISFITIGDHKVHSFFDISNSHIIETPKRLILVDAQFNFNAAQELKDYIENLNKPLEKIILSHAHPDHWFGAEVFEEIPVVTSKKIASDLSKMGQTYIDGLKPVLGEIIPDSVIAVRDDVVLGSQDLDGLNIVIEEYADQEAPHSLAIKIPEYGVFIGQDLFYHDTHLVAPNRDGNKNWAKLLEGFNKKEAGEYKTILTGHGPNTNPGVFKEDIEYLEVLESILESGASKEEVKEQLLEKFPDKKGENFIDITLRYLFG